MFTTIAVLLLAFAHGERCATDVDTILCEDKSGIFFRRDDGNIQTATSRSEIDVSAGERFSLSICNFNNLDVDGDKTLSEALIENIIGDIGEGAHLKILVESSANIRMTRSQLLLQDDTEEALIDELISGDISDDVHISLSMVESGNIYSTGSSFLEIDEWSLIDQVLDSSDDLDEEDDLCFEFQFYDCANIYGDNGLNVRLDEGGALLENIIDIDFGTNSYGSFIFDTVGNVQANTLRMDDSELMDDLCEIDFKESMPSGSVAIAVVNSAHVEVSRLFMEGSELISEAVDLDDHVGRATVDINLDNVANVHATSLVDMDDSHLVEHFLELDDDSTRGGFTITLATEDAGNIKCRQLGHSVKLVEESSLMYELVDADSSTSFPLDISIQHSANAYVERSRYTLSSDSTLLERSDVPESITNSGRQLSRCTLTE